ncbi:MarR family winged helix-turn-helix transcriptional regulator [Ornithinicoccus hortensis]|uniref:DNA-binding MarR family transcriptional regulator n=1 Tax=Ornithinicoccus hortensis TaxID=82346 RepID=A0A542YVQ6_9MICO|nr:MarR family transcriptional regulator [Ornithinicoccus hortensis]TQL52169.1 DNA-binding MarR family transcriptional regulator [Ornithinicoccus hortensis]
MPAAPAPAPEVVHLAHDLRIACMRVSRRVRFEASSNIAPHHFSVLVRLADSPSTVGDLATSERVSAPSMSRTVSALVDRGLVARAGSPDDGRVVQLSLTDEGQATVVSERAKRDAWMSDRLGRLTSRERDVLTRATEILGRVLAE